MEFESVCTNSCDIQGDHYHPVIFIFKTVPNYASCLNDVQNQYHSLSTYAAVASINRSLKDICSCIVSLIPRGNALFLGKIYRRMMI